MTVLKNPRHERFAQALARGEPAGRAYVLAGYARNDGNSIRLKGNEKIAARVAEIQGRAAERTEVTVASITARLLAIATKGEAAEKDAALLGVGRLALMDAAKLNGLIVDKRELDLTNLTDEQIVALASALGAPAAFGEGARRDRTAPTTH